MTGNNMAMVPQRFQPPEARAYSSMFPECAAAERCRCAREEGPNATPDRMKATIPALRVLSANCFQKTPAVMLPRKSYLSNSSQSLRSR